MNTLPRGMQSPQDEAIAAALSAEMRTLMQETWRALLHLCLSRLAPGHAAVPHINALAVPDADLLLRSLERAITPAMLLALPLADPLALRAALLAHECASVREQTLDALDAPWSGRTALGGICAAWSRRILAGEIGGMPDLTCAERLALQEELDQAPGGTYEAEPQTLATALACCANRRATTLLAARADVPCGIVEAAVAMRDRRLLLSLCCKAGCDAQETLAVQVQLARIPPDQAMDEQAGDQQAGGLDDATMRWRLADLHEF